VDVVNTRTNVSRVCLILKDLQQLSIRFRVLDRHDISIQGSNSVKEVLELGVAEVRVDLGDIFDTSSGEAERLNGPVEVEITLLSGAEGKTLTESGLIDLDNTDTCSLKVDDFITESKGELLSLHRLVNIITGERPPQASDRASKHTLHCCGCQYDIQILKALANLLGLLVIEAAYLDSLTVIGAGLEISPTTIGGRTQRDPYD